MKCEQDIWFVVVRIETVMGCFKEMASAFCGVTKRIRFHYVSHKLLMSSSMLNRLPETLIVVAYPIICRDLLFSDASSVGYKERIKRNVRILSANPGLYNIHFLLLCAAD
jgi:hypothetical protein